MSVQTAQTAVQSLPLLPQAVPVAATTTDPMFKVLNEGQGLLRFSGIAAGDDHGGSDVTLRLDGNSFSVSLQKGMTPAVVANLVARVLPRGLRVEVVQPSRGSNDVVIQIVRD